jgi:small redox-active disulfide protein 2
MEIEVLGPGCKRCEQLYQNTVEAISQVGAAAQIQVKKVADMNYFIQKGVFVTPGLIIDGKVVSTGKLLSVAELLDLIKENM